MTIYKRLDVNLWVGPCNSREWWRRARWHGMVEESRNNMQSYYLRGKTILFE